MPLSENIPLRHLLKRQEMELLLQEFSALSPGGALILTETDGQQFAAVGDWEPPDLTTALPQLLQGQMIQHANFIALPLLVKLNFLGALLARQPINQTALRCLHGSLILLLTQALETRDVARETLERYREINLLYTIGETISASLNPQAIYRLVLEGAGHTIQCNVGGILLLSAEDPTQLSVESCFGAADCADILREIGEEILDKTCRAGQAIITTKLRAASKLNTILCAPLKTQKKLLGMILLGRVSDETIFTAGDEKLLATLSGQAAIAVENAQLFADLKRQHDAITEMKRYTDNIFASIASGVITIDSEDAVVTLNRAAKKILQVQADKTIGRPYAQALPGLGPKITSLINAVKAQNAPLTGHELQTSLPHKESASLRLHISPLKDKSQSASGVAIVLDDLTERRQLERRVRQVRQTFERYVAPQVVNQLLSDPARVKLGGERHTVTILFADLRNFTAFSEQHEPETLLEILNQHLTLAVEAILSEEGTLDKFQGDAALALFNVPLPQPDHVLRAVRAALNIQQATAELHRRLPPEHRLGFGIGITSGPVIVGNVGSEAIHNYTAIGRSINMADRIQSQAKAGQILLSNAAYQQVRDRIVAHELGLIRLKGHAEPDLVFEVLDIAT